MAIRYDTILNLPSTKSDNNSMMEIIIVGDSEVGKTRLGARMMENEFVQINLKIKAITVVGNSSEMQTARQMQYRSITQSYFRKTDAVVYIYDITNQTSFEDIKQWMNEFKEDRGQQYLVGNKCDLEKKREVSTQLGAILAVEHGMNFLETSAKANINCTELLVDIANKFKEKSMGRNNEDVAEKQERNDKEKEQKMKKKQKKKKFCGCFSWFELC